MKLYDALSVTLGYQLNGSNSLVQLTGPTEEIELAFNGLFNYGAVPVGRLTKMGTLYGTGQLSYHDASKTIASFWTNNHLMENYWYNRGLPIMGNCSKRARLYAQRKMWETLSSRENIRGINLLLTIGAEEYTMGTLEQSAIES